jgi:hypothetical protein
VVAEALKTELQRGFDAYLYFHDEKKEEPHVQYEHFPPKGEEAPQVVRLVEETVLSVTVKVNQSY